MAGRKWFDGSDLHHPDSSARSRRAMDPISLVEAAYRFEGDEDSTSSRRSGRRRSRSTRAPGPRLARPGVPGSGRDELPGGPRQRGRARRSEGRRGPPAGRIEGSSVPARQPPLARVRSRQRRTANGGAGGMGGRAGHSPARRRRFRRYNGLDAAGLGVFKSPLRAHEAPSPARPRAARRSRAWPRTWWPACGSEGASPPPKTDSRMPTRFSRRAGRSPTRCVRRASPLIAA